MFATLTTLDSGYVVRGEPRSPIALLRLLLLTAALSATAGALATAVLDRRAAASAPPRLSPVAAQLPLTTGGRDPSVPDAGSVFFGREATPDDPVAGF